MIALLGVVMQTLTFLNNKNQNTTLNGRSNILLSDFLTDKVSNLRKMHDSDIRISCNCIPEGVISTTRLTDETYMLVRLPSSANHKVTCDLWRCEAGKMSPPKKGDTIKKFVPYSIGNKAGEPKGNNGGSSSPQSTTRSHKLFSMLCHALAGQRQSGKGRMELNIYRNTSKYNLSRAYYSAALDAEITNHTNTPLLMKSITNIGSKICATETEDFINKKSFLFSEKVPVQFYNIFVADTCVRVGNTIKVERNSDETSYDVLKPTMRFERTNGPRICMLITALIDGEWQYPAMYTHPIVSAEIPIMVDSGIERDFFLSVKSQLKDTMVIEKPYFSDDFHGTPLLPDFFIRDMSLPKETRTVVVEVMGMMNSVDYTERKEIIIPKMNNRYKTTVKEVLPETMAADVEYILSYFSNQSDCS